MCAQPEKPSNQNAIRLRGVRQNNLKGFDLDLPLGELIVVTGLSGAGKSSLVFETLHAEGQRRYVETFSPYTRQFMDMLDRPQVDSIENIRPSIAIEQRNTVKTSRSSVGTMTELCDYFKIWFAHHAHLLDPASGEVVTDDNPQSIWKQAAAAFSGQTVLLAFAVNRVGKLTWETVLESLGSQGYTRAFVSGERVQLDKLDPEGIAPTAVLHVVQDRLKLEPPQRNRFIEAATTALHFGQGDMLLLHDKGQMLARYAEGLRSPVTGRRFRAPSPNLFSFNSPLGACPVCRGFGRVIEMDEGLVLPDTTKTLAEGAIRAFQGVVYSESQRDMMKACRQHGVRTNIAWSDLTEAERSFVMDGEAGYGVDGREWPQAWYGVRNFFKWLESKTYKMHVRVFLSKYRAYVPCPACKGDRLNEEARLWEWKGYRLPALYRLPVDDLLAMMEKEAAQTGDKRADLALEAILTRLRFLCQVGLGYLTLDRSSRSLSGGETQRATLTSCLGTGLVDTLFVLDEPSVGLHARDIDRLTGILRHLVAQGNTVVVVEHDESIMRAADTLIEVGPRPGKNGGTIVAQGSFRDLSAHPFSITGAYLSGRQTILPPEKTRPVKSKGKSKAGLPWLRIERATKHNLRDLSVNIPLTRFVVLSGVSGSGKSTLLDNVLYQGLLSQAGKSTDNPARIARIESDTGFGEIVLVDQSPVTRTPRSNAALYVDAWDPIRRLFAATAEAKAGGLTASHFSFNSGQGRCPHCEGLGYEKIEMQFMADVYVQCPLCEGKRFRKEVLDLKWNERSVADVLDLSIEEATTVFADQTRIRRRLQNLVDVGLGYLHLGQPLHTLSGGESQRLKLVKFLGRFEASSDHALILVDEPTTGLHRDDVARLLDVLQKLVDQGHSLIVIEHQMDVLRAADWVIELGPEAGAAGGEIVFEGTPLELSRAKSATAPFLATAALPPAELLAAEDPVPYGRNGRAEAGPAYLTISGAREHNLKNISLRIQHGALTVVTGVSGSGKSTLAFDIVFAESQRRFMESMSSWARQYVEQLPRPDIDFLEGIPPAVAIEQRITRGTRKSTVATITEVAQYMRLLFARVGTPYSPHNDQPLVALSPEAIAHRIEAAIKRHRPTAGKPLLLCAPLVRGRKGHHQPLADWAAGQGFSWMRADSHWVRVDKFEKLDRYREHDVEVALAEIRPQKKGFVVELAGTGVPLGEAVDRALRVGKDACFLAVRDTAETIWFSTRRSDPVTGEAFPELDPKSFSWNSARGWCPICRGHGAIFDWMTGDERFEDVPDDVGDGEPCPACVGTRLNSHARAVYLDFHDGSRLNIGGMLALTPQALLAAMGNLRLDKRGTAVLDEVLPEIRQRLHFMDEVGLDYLSLDRATNTLSGGEAQRIRLAAQLGSNLSGVLYVLDEPSIGLHARDNARLLQSLAELKAKGNSLLVVEHDPETMRAADCIIDLGPGAGRHGGEILAQGNLEAILASPDSLTGRYLKAGMVHPLRGKWRDLPPPFAPRRKTAAEDWLILEEPRLRNLKGGTMRLPKARLIGVCGISGAGKSTLVRDLLQPAVADAIRTKTARLKGSPANQFALGRLLHGDTFRQVIEVDQSPIGKTPRSTPATYIGAFDIIRDFFAALPEAKMRGFGPGTFSFNTKGGRCETCKGAGRIALEMNFIADTYLTCEDCNGRRYGPELLGIHWKDRSIADILEMSFEEAAGFFSFHSRLGDMLRLMVETGLGYLTLGQSSPTLSGGEAQRLKLVSELAKGLPTFQERKTGRQAKNLYILEEPTIGLHQSDTERLIELLHRLVDQGHSVIVIEHNLDLLAEADYLLEIGPEGGERGGELIYQGPVSGLLKVKRSPTAPFMRDLLRPQKKQPHPAS